MLIQNYFLYRKDQVYTCHCSKQTSKLSQLQNKKIWIYLQLISLPFTYWIEVNLRTLINRRWEWIILSVRSLTVFEENIVVTALAKLILLFFQKCTCAFFFLYALQLTGVRLWQIFVKMFQIFFGNLFNHPSHYANENLSVKPLYFHYFNFKYPLLVQKLFSLWKILQ